MTPQKPPYTLLLQLQKAAITLAVSFGALAAQAQGWLALSQGEMQSGLQQALTQSADKAISQLGVTDGFLKNQAVKILLPEPLQKVESTLRMFGMGAQADELVLRMNRAAEAAAPHAKALLWDSVKQMSFSDARSILSGPPDAATQYFRRTTADKMTAQFLPIVKQATANMSLADQYNRVAGAAQRFGMLSAEQANIENYITQKALDGVFLMMAQEEKAIRQDPIGQASNLLKKVFGSLGR